MKVDMFSVTNGYGFCSSKEGLRVFFRVEDFIKNSPEEPQPILGEPVEVQKIVSTEGSPKAVGVVRIDTPKIEVGEVKSFDSTKGWGFAESSLGIFFIHKSDFIEPFIPVIRSRITFYPGNKRGKRRACYISSGNVYKRGDYEQW